MAKKRGRPLTDISPEQFEELCKILCTEEEIADVFGCSIDTIERFCKRTYKDTFRGVYKHFSAQGKMSLRRAQYRNAVENNNTQMQIWLGRNWLGQTDKPAEAADTEDTEAYFEEAGI